MLTGKFGRNLNLIVLYILTSVNTSYLHNNIIMYVNNEMIPYRTSKFNSDQCFTTHACVHACSWVH